MGKRWDFLKKFESNFNHWYVPRARASVIISHIFSVGSR